MKQKIKIQIKALKSRNSLVPLLFSLKSGSHEKTHKSVRQKEKIKIKKNIAQHLNDEL